MKKLIINCNSPDNYTTWGEFVLYFEKVNHHWLVSLQYNCVDCRVIIVIIIVIIFVIFILIIILIIIAIEKLLKTPAPPNQ